ncbi:MAG: hypothetical protein U1F11_07155 [Steroidobacteraceae bacterium]
MIRNRNTAVRGASALLTLAALAALPQAWAAGTPASTAINNRATVNFTVGGVAQTPIESSPTGNTNPGVNNGANTSFVVDNRVDLTVTEVSGAATIVNPGQANVVAGLRVTNTGNAPQAYQLTAANIASGATLFGNADNIDVSNLRVFVDANGNGTYEPATDTATSIATLAADANVQVFIVADVPIGATNAQYSNVRLTAAAAVNNTPATLLTQSAGADNPATVEIVFADGAGAGDAARDGQHSNDDQYAVQSAALSIQKTSAVVSDPLNGTTNPKAIPGSVVEYTITLTNTGAVAAAGLVLSDPVPTNTTFAQNQYSGNTRDVRITVNAVDSFCIAEAGGTDSNGDGCVRTAGGNLQVGAPALASVATGAGNAVNVRFRVSIN